MNIIPNSLSFFRIILIPLFVWYMVQDKTLAAAITLAVSGLTDFLDGWLARRFNWISQFGKMLDPMADKLTQVTVCLVMVIKLQQYWYFFLILFLKELLMLVLGGYLVKKGVKLEGAKFFGKVTTTVFYISMIFIVFIPTMPNQMVVFLLSLTTICAIISAFMYIPDFLHYREEIRRSGQDSEEWPGEH